MTDAIEIYQREDEDWGYRIKGENGQIMAQSEGYVSAFNANRGAQSLVRRLKEVDKNVIASIAGVEEPTPDVRTFSAEEYRRVGAKTPVTAVVDAQGMDIVLVNDEVHITVVGPKNKDSYKLVIKGEDLNTLKKALVAAENAVPSKEDYLLSIIDRASNYTATPPTIDTLIEWVQSNRGEGINPFVSTDLSAEVRDVIVDLFFARKIRTDNKKGLIITDRTGR
jgi:uncharacterized protein YegP (UPF0339 family)